MEKSEKIPRIMLAGTGSSCGKTTITCAILKALCDRGLRITSFKAGPDYIDPLFHTKVTGTKSRNLDVFMLGEDAVKYLLAKNAGDKSISIIEGVMGLYDGIGTEDDFGSSNQLANVTNTPVILVLNCKGMYLSLCAQLEGYLKFMKNNICAVILNHTSQHMYPVFKEMIEKKFALKVLGYMPSMPEVAFDGRHLGLVTADEIENINIKLNTLATMAEKTIDLDMLISLANGAEALRYENIEIEKIKIAEEVTPIKISIAKDEAFCFYYQDNIDLLEELGAEIEFFSPVHDKKIPDGTDAFIFGGGYPELYAEKLSRNQSMLASIQNALQKGIKCLAECGGFMYLQQSIKDLAGKEYKMVGALEGNPFMTGKLSRFGYLTLEAGVDNLLCKKGQTIQAHEFHYSDSSFTGEDFHGIKPNKKSRYDCITANENIVAGYPHIHFWSNIEFAKNFMMKIEKGKRDDVERSVKKN